MSKKGVLCACFLWCLVACVWAHTETKEEEPTVTYDGVGTTTNCKIMYPGHCQVEMASGVTREKLAGEWGSEWLLNATLIRYGLNSHVELQMEVDQSSAKRSGETKYGVSNIALGTKIKLNHGIDRLPEASIHALLNLPGKKDANFLPQKMGGLTNLLMHNDVSSWYDLDYVIGIQWTGEDSTPAYFLGLCNNFPLSDQLTVMLQSQNLLYHGTWSNDLQLEASYMIQRHVMLDVSSNWNLNDLGTCFDAMLTIAVLF